MAFRDQLGNGLPFYNLTQAVGNMEDRLTLLSGGRMALADNSNTVAPNRRDDVMLVQYLLRGILRRKSPQTAAKLAVDGFLGPITQGAINQFQFDLRGEAVLITTDGRVDRARGAVTSISATVYTIVWLNFKFQQANPTVDFANIQNDPAMPALLRAAIGTPRGVPVVTD
jgi:hypothetical protein